MSVTRKKILVNKNEWLIALDELIVKYQSHLTRKERFSGYDSGSCALCTVAKQLRSEIAETEQHYLERSCIVCIHNSSFSQNKTCHDQISFINVRLSFRDLNIKAHYGFIKRRIKVIRGIIVRLEKSDLKK